MDSLRFTKTILFELLDFFKSYTTTILPLDEVYILDDGYEHINRQMDDEFATRIIRNNYMIGGNNAQGYPNRMVVNGIIDEIISSSSFNPQPFISPFALPSPSPSNNGGIVYDNIEEPITSTSVFNFILEPII
jgi:hypothetical protein